jgi:hypothetical protein
VTIALNPDFEASRIMRNKFLMFIIHPAYGNFVVALGKTKTRSASTDISGEDSAHASVNGQTYL